ncbi:hypothetical protein VTO58DRAFT_110972 [Aureobasidium pullulans]
MSIRLPGRCLSIFLSTTITRQKESALDVFA